MLAPLFPHSRDSDGEVPRCQVLFVYCDIGPDGRVVGRPEGIRGLAKSAGAWIVVVVSEPCAGREAMGPEKEWHANIVLTIDRKGENFPRFFASLFAAMFAGKSMLLAWVELVPQIPNAKHEGAPATFMLAEAGHLLFG